MADLSDNGINVETEEPAGSGFVKEVISQKEAQVEAMPSISGITQVLLPVMTV